MDEGFLKRLAENRMVTTKKAAEFIDNCIKQVSAKFDVEYSKVYEIIKEIEYRSLQEEYKKCGSRPLSDCESPYCIDWKGSCIPKMLPDADLINRDPDRYISTHIKSTDQLKKLVKLASYLYYNYEGGGITDNSYDALEWHLMKRLKLKQMVYEKIGAPVVEKIRVKLPYIMPSLSKVKPGTIALYNFLDSEQEPRTTSYVWSHKLDGVSGMVVYTQNGLKAIYTRGTGVIGGDVTYLKDYLDFPDIQQDIVVRGEFVLSKEIWEMKYNTVQEGKPWQSSQLQMYANARSFISSKINSAHILPELKDIHFVAYNIVHMPGLKIPKPSKALKILFAKGFEVVKYKKVPSEGLKHSSLSTFYLMHIYREERSTSQYFIDGLVVSKNVERETVSELTDPRFSVAFKMILEEQVRSTKIINIDWNISRYGKYIPVAIYESVYISGIRLHRASAHNAAHIRDWNMGVGTEVKIVRSGDVIPVIKDVEVNHDIEPIFPDYSRGKWHWERSDLVLNKIDSNREVQIKRMVHFFTVLEVPRLREKTLEKFWESGYHHPEDIVRASVEDMKKIKGLGIKSSADIKNNINKSLSSVPPDRFLVASTTLKSGIGRKLIKTLFHYIPNIISLSSDEINAELSKRKIPGFGKKRVENVAQNFPKFKDYLFSFAKTQVEESIRKYRLNLERLEMEGYNDMIKGKTFVLTSFFGKTNYNLEDYIYDNQGDFSTTVTSNTEAVIVGNISEITNKMEQAWNLGIPVYDMEEFKKYYMS